MSFHAMVPAMPRLAACLAMALTLGACMGTGPTTSQAPATAVPVPVVTQSALPPAGAAQGPAVAAAGEVPLTGRASSSPSSSMALAPGARQSVSLTNVSRTSTGASSSGNALGGTLVSGQSAGAIPTVVDRNREPPRYRHAAPRDTMGPGTAPPIVAPELRDTTGNTLRNRQRVQF
ncbi:hypothetical protein [Phreatobacter sp.]|uniref:hypothetical protein n=1 Tax=Phreatobacter sp. TaxID=1966341 RepID=UPI003F6FB0AB